MNKVLQPPLGAILFLSLLIFSCSSSNDAQPCDSDSAIDLRFGTCLVFEDNGQLDNERSEIEQVTRNAVALVNNLMPVEDLLIRIRVAPNNVIPEIGLGGFNPSEKEIIISFDPNFPDLPQSISNELGPQIAHEMHHAKRRRFTGYGSTLFEASVTEGLADCFTMEVMGIAPPIWSVSLSGTELDDWINTARDTWNDNPYNHGKWFLGTTSDVPRWAGYAIGYKLVKDFLADNPSRNPSDLFDEPASSFLK